ncbi:hypothetical protein [Novosphingobium sp. HII-3]|uniref:hypothetical protein n=1 Tax=Novosphingobium sp. HII-3 TaxID=2075565 RepID=UPI000CDB76BB|nr:hypothetical protein [Novosphingobium sp. HII-3]
MKRHFKLTLKLSPDDLLILTTYLEHAYDRALIGRCVMPGPLSRRLRELAAADPTDMGFHHLIMLMSPGWEISDVEGDAVTIVTGPAGASLAQTIELLGRLVPSCLETEIHYEPVGAAQDPEGNALH